MSLISKKFADELADKGMRASYLAAQTRTKIVAQIRAIRKLRGWSQADFAKRLEKPQSNVSQRLENRDYAGFTVNTLLEIASTFDVGLVVEFVPYEDFIRQTDDLSDDRLNVEPFEVADLQPLYGEQTASLAQQPQQTAIAVQAFMNIAYNQTQSIFQSAANADNPAMPMANNALTTTQPAQNPSRHELAFNQPLLEASALRLVS